MTPQISQAYLEGTWVELPSHCQAKSIRQLESFAYGFEQECRNAKFQCGPGQPLFLFSLVE